MQKMIVFVILLILLSLWGFGVILPDAGYLLLVLGQKTLETSLWFACFAALAICFCWWLASRFVRASWSLAQRVTDFFVFGSTERASKRAASGLIDFLSGDWLQARKKLLRTATKVESPLVNYLAAARCSFELGDRDEAIKILEDAQKKYPKFEVAISLVQVKMDMAAGHYEHARQMLVVLQQKAPKNAVVINGLRKVYEVRQDWVALREIFPHVKKHKLCSVSETQEMEASVMIGELKSASDAALREVPQERLDVLRKAWGRVPSYQQKMPRVVAAYAQALIEHFHDQEAEAVLRKTITRTWDNTLANLYGVLRVSDLTQAMRNAEDWLRVQPNNPVLLRALGRLSLRNHLWGLARDYFQRSLSAEPNSETYAELARLLNNLGDTQKSMEAYQAALQLSLTLLPDLPQPAKSY